MNSVADSVKELVDADYTRFRATLLREKGHQRQREFLEQVRHSSEFLECVSALPAVGSFEVDLAPSPMTESEFKDPPGDTERGVVHVVVEPSSLRCVPFHLLGLAHARSTSGASTSNRSISRPMAGTSPAVRNASTSR